MIKVTKYINRFDGYPFYIAKATKLDRRATGDTRKLALKNLKNVIRKINKKIVL
jgi:hypothetical protein